MLDALSDEAGSAGVVEKAARFPPSKRPPSHMPYRRR